MPNVKRLKMEGSLTGAGASGGGDPPQDHNNDERSLNGIYNERSKSKKRTNTKEERLSMERRRSARMSTTSRMSSRSTGRGKKEHEIESDDTLDLEDEEDDSDRSLGTEGFQIVPALTRDISYSPPFFYQSNDVEDEEFSARLQLEADMAVYRESSTEDEFDEEERIYMDDVDYRIEAAYESAADAYDFNNIRYDNPAHNGIEFNSVTYGNATEFGNTSGFNNTSAAIVDNVSDTDAPFMDDGNNDFYAPIHAPIFNNDGWPIAGGGMDDGVLGVYQDDIVANGDGVDEEDPEEIVMLAADDPERHSRVYYETNRWTCLVDSRYPTLTDLLYERGYRRGVRGYFNVPWTQIWGLIAESGLGTGGWGYSICQLITVYHNDGHGPN